VAKARKSPAWAAGYIGIPFADCGRDRSGADCWGFIRLVLRERFAVEIPSYDAVYFHTRDFASMRRIFDEQAKAGCWIEVMPRYEAPGREREGDIVHMRVAGEPGHVGIVIAPGQMLHACDGVDSVRCDFDGMEWKHRILGIYRHRDLAAQD
jgi:cell wall-associated NlpC family hydrolase